ncbi:TonB-dependent receptor [Bradyrhizobium sp.]|uniref:TonB-dependent receptor n=1 Tax=Bradyrhizobium sp. TaxID=376 RepID=UPI00260A0201|nr:TonB-dependent receptor [Bradyrhizobium sp.]
MKRSSKAAALSGSALLLFALDAATLAQTGNAGTNNAATNGAETSKPATDTAGNGVATLPSIEVTAPNQTAAARKKQKPRAVAARHPLSSTTAQSTSDSSATPPAAQATQLAVKNGVFDQARGNIFATTGTTSDTIGHDTIQNLPQGANQPVEQLLLQAPGVSQDSAASGLFHVRNDHANVQFRINGVLLPDGVTGFGSIFDTSFIGSMSLVTGALPAEYGLRTTGLIDITTRSDLFNNSGSVGMYAGSHGTIQPSIEYGGTFGSTCPTTTPGTHKAAASSANCFAGVQYYFTGRYLQNTLGIENPTPAYNAIHDFSQQDRGFAYVSAFVDPSTRVSLIAGTAYNSFEIPNNPGQPTSPAIASAFGVSNFNSAALNENQVEKTQFSVLSLQKSVDGFDGQLSYFTRYNELRFTPDPIGDLLINGIASDIGRISYTNGIAGDGSYKLNSSHMLRAGFSVSAEQAAVENTSLVENLNGSGVGVEPPFGITNNVSRLGWLAGVYVQDEWKVTDQFTINGGLRFDQMDQFVSANQFSPRLSFTYKPFDNTTFHAGYARYFTPPVLVEAAPNNIALFNNTTGAVSGQNDPVLPERSHYFDAGVDQKFKFGCGSDGKNCSSLDLGVDAYYKITQDLIDNGLFGQALVLDAFNYARGYNEGIEFKARFTSGNFQLYGNLSVAQQRANDPVSNRYLFNNTTPLADLGGMTELQYLQTHFIYTDHNQFVTASAGGLYQFCGRPATTAEASGDNGFSWCGVKLSADMIYGSGLRDGDANIATVSPYTQVNIGIQREFLLPNDPKPMTIRFDVVNLFDNIYEIRDGTGIGVFAPQFGARRGFFLGISKKI